MDTRTLHDLDVRGKRVFVRVDFNVPLEGGRITDDSRIRAALPTINYLLDQGARVILASHLGRPKGKVAPEHSLRPVADRLGELLGRPVRLAPDCVGPAAEEAVAVLGEGAVLLLENLRFHREEEENEPGFARALASLADVYVNDAFGTAHRAHASTAGIAEYLPAAAGFLMIREIESLGRLLAAPERPFVAILGGAKVSDKIGVIRNLLGRVDALVIGGGMANTFLRARGLDMARSLVEEEKTAEAREIMDAASKRGATIHLPVDAVAAPAPQAGVECRDVPVDAIPAGWAALDIGPETAKNYAAVVSGSRTVFWNGPMGVFEVPPFDRGTLAVARAMAESGATTVVGGGDSVAALEALGLADRMTHISTGGGASLEFLEGRELPGVAALRK